MTLLGKIFTVLIFIMSLVFMSFSVMVFATHKNWKAMVLNPAPNEPGYDSKYDTGLKTQVEQRQQMVDQLRTELAGLENDLARERAARSHALAVLQTKWETAQKALEQKETELAERTAAQTQQAIALQAAENNLSKAIDEVNAIREEIRTTLLDRDGQLGKVVALTDELHQSRGIRRRLEERRDQLVAEVAAQKRVMDAYDLTVHSRIDNLAPPLDGIVTAISKNDFVEISIGSDDGLADGDYIEIFRGPAYLGRAVVKTTSPDRAVAQILAPTKQGNVQVNDRVRTKVERLTLAQ